MSRIAYNQDLMKLRAAIMQMGQAVAERMAKTMDALARGDKVVATEIAGSDKEIDEMERHIERMCMSLITHQQPVARDLRVITACLKMVTDIERIADQCADISEIIAGDHLGNNAELISHILKMGEKALTMIKDALDAFDRLDTKLAREVCMADDEVDALFSKIILEVCRAIGQNSQDPMSDVDLMFITKYVERIADHATNIAEWVIYVKTSELPALKD